MTKRLFLWITGIVVVYAVWQHLRFLFVLPDPFFQPDSGSYFLPAASHHFGGAFDVPAKRTLGYPVFIAACLALTKNFSGLLVLQHVLALYAAAVSGFICVRFFKAPKAAGLTVFLLTAMLPRFLVYAHMVMTEILYTACVLSCLLLLFYFLEKPSMLRGGVLGALLWTALFVRPSGRSLIFATFLALLVYAVRGIHYRRGTVICGVVLTALWAVACYHNQLTRGFWGMEQFKGLSLYGTTARYSQPPDATDKFKDSNWVRYDPAGPVMALKKTYTENAELEAELMRLSFEGIKQHPILFLSDQVKAFAQFLWSRSGRPAHLLRKDQAMSIGLRMYFENPSPGMEKLIRFNIGSAKEYFYRIFRMKLYPFEPTPSTFILWPWVHLVRWVGILALILTPPLLTNDKLKPGTIILWLVIVGHIATSNLGADTDGRHAIPVDPLYVMLAAAGVHAAATKFKMKPWKKT